MIGGDRAGSAAPFKKGTDPSAGKDPL